MTKGTYSYALLQYHHSQILGEVLNIGILLYFPDFKRLDFIFPEKLIRLRFAYPNVPEKTIKAYFKNFTNRVNELNINKEVFSDYNLDTSLEKFVDAEFLPSDSSSLQFGNFRKGVLYSENLELIKNQLYNLYFSVFQHHENISRRIDESHLLTNYKKLLREITDSNIAELRQSERFKTDYSIEPNIGTKIRFDVAWRGDRYLHLVKPISFDLLKQESIINKAYRYYGQFTDLEQYAENESLNFDVLLAKPKKKDLFKVYDNALRLLEKPKRVSIIEQNDIEKYSRDTIEQIINTDN